MKTKEQDIVQSAIYFWNRKTFNGSEITLKIIELFRL